MNNKERSKLIRLPKQVREDEDIKIESSRLGIIFIINAGSK
ncbi:hypothetical protein [Photorhabdus noenieputensis]|nr:hypothetical protein [Photorhabdus noenieputensis]